MLTWRKKNRKIRKVKEKEGRLGLDRKKIEEKEIGPKPNYKSPIAQGPISQAQTEMGPRKIQSSTEMSPRHIQIPCHTFRNS
jgi:hypothetical protein